MSTCRLYEHLSSNCGGIAHCYQINGDLLKVNLPPLLYVPSHMNAKRPWTIEVRSVRCSLTCAKPSIRYHISHFCTNFSTSKWTHFFSGGYKKPYLSSRTQARVDHYKYLGLNFSTSWPLSSWFHHVRKPENSSEWMLKRNLLFFKWSSFTNI